MQIHGALAGFILSLFIIAPASAAPPAGIAQEIASGIRYLEASQAKPGDGAYLPGEWPIQLTTGPVVAGLGIGRAGESFEDPSAFVTAKTHNLLAETYLLGERLPGVPA